MKIRLAFNITILLLLINYVPALALQKIDPAIYSSHTIPDSLKKNADAVARLDSYDFTIKSPGKAQLKIHTIVTLLNSKADAFSYFYQRHNKFVKLTDAEVNVYDADGELIKKFPQKDMRDEAANGDATLVGDERVSYLSVPVNDYPITIEEEFEQDFSSLLDYEEWDAIEANTALQHGSVTVRVPADLDIRYKVENIKLPAKITTERGDKIYHWEVNNIAAIKDEPRSRQENTFPKILIAPVKFEYDDIPGDFTSWKNFGMWSYNFYNSDEASTFSPERTVQIKAMVADAKTEKEKIKILYDYLQKNTRYVSIQLGIGGFKPFPASFVDEKKYGDCKALSNYMHALLKAVNIPSYPALVYGNESNWPEAENNFPQNDFNHVILCVPLQNDTVWLECTSNINEFNVLGSFAENRKALLITKNGGVLVHTPASHYSENDFSSYTTIKLNDDESGEAAQTIYATGDFKDLFYALLMQNDDDQKRYCINGLGYKLADEMQLKKIAGEGNDFHTKINMQFEKIPEFAAGSKLFLLPRLYKLSGVSVPFDSARKYDFYFPFPFCKTDTTVYLLPKNYSLDNMPAAANFKFAGGYYTTKYNYDKSKNQLSTITNFVLENTCIPAAEYDNMHLFFNKLVNDNNQRIVVKKEEE